MKELIRVTILATLLFCFSLNVALGAECPYPTPFDLPSGDCAVECPAGYTVYRVYHGPYADQAAATAAGVATGYPFVTSLTDVRGTPYSAEQYRQQTTPQCASCSKTLHNYFYCPAGENCTDQPPDGQCQAGQSDIDSDGMNDHCDPYPNDSSNVPWRVVHYEGNSHTMTETFSDWDCIQIETTRGDSFTYGTCTGSNTNGFVGAPWRNQEQLETFGICGAAADTYSPSYGGDQVGTDIVNTETDRTSGGDIDSGLDNTGNTTDQDYLADIVENTRATAESQGIIYDALRDLEDAVRDNTIITSGAGGTGDSTSPQETTDSIIDAENQMAEDNQAEIDGYQNDITGADTSGISGIAQIGGEVGDIPDEDTLSTFWDTILANSPVSQYLGGSTVTTTGAECSLTWNYNGTPIELTMCGFQPEVQAFGAVILAFASIWALILVFRR